MEDFGRNLRLLCGYAPSVSAICRRIGINRQQFYRYLNGQSLPGLRVMRRLCDHFGVEEWEILQDHQDFKRLVAVRKPPLYRVDPLGQHLLDLDKINKDSTLDLKDYVGYYFSYFCPADFPGKVMRSLVQMRLQNDFVYIRTFENYRTESMRRQKRLSYKGVVYHTGEKIVIHERERFVGKMIWTTMLDPADADQFSVLTGLTMGATSSMPRQTACYRVVWQRLAPSTAPTKALSDCGVFPLGNDALPRNIVELITRPADSSRGSLLASRWEERLE